MTEQPTGRPGEGPTVPRARAGPAEHAGDPGHRTGADPVERAAGHPPHSPDGFPPGPAAGTTVPSAPGAHPASVAPHRPVPRPVPGPEDRTTSAVRPYVITGGRAGTHAEPLHWESLVVAAGTPVPASLQPEHRMILAHCQGLLSVAEVAAHLGQPPSVIQVLLSDLVDWGLILTRPPIPPAERADVTMLRKVLDGLESRL